MTPRRGRGGRPHAPDLHRRGLRAAHQIRSEHPEIGVLVLSQYVETTYALELFAGGTGGLGYLLKDRVADVREFTDAVRRVGAGGSVIDPDVVASLVSRAHDSGPLDTLTDREREVLALMAEGRSNQAISDRMYLNPKTVEGHVRSIFTKLDLLPAPDDHRRVLARAGLPALVTASSKSERRQAQLVVPASEPGCPDGDEGLSEWR